MIDPKLVAKWMAKYQEIEKKRKAQGLPPLTYEEANRQGFQDGLQDAKAFNEGVADNLTTRHARTAQSVRVTRERAVLWSLSNETHDIIHLARHRPRDLWQDSVSLTPFLTHY